jgi:hypothetical protein
MPERNRGTRPRCVDQGFPHALAQWIRADGDLLEALATVRRLGTEGDDALEALLKVRRISELKASWGLWQALAEGDGDDPEALLLRVLPLGPVEEARNALWGCSWRDADPGGTRGVGLHPVPE